MAKVKRLKPRRKWTNRLAWSVWKIRRSNKLRSANKVWVDGEGWTDSEAWVD